MAKPFRPYVPEQELLRPPSLKDWVPADHLASVVGELVDPGGGHRSPLRSNHHVAGRRAKRGYWEPVRS